MTEQLSIFDLLGTPETPEIPFEAQKEGRKGWIIEITAVLLTHPKKVMYMERNGDFHETWGYENGYQKGA